MPGNVPAAITAADIRNLIDSVADWASQEVLTKTAGYSATVGDNRRRIVFDSATAVTFILPATLPVGWECSILQKGAGQVMTQVTGGAILSRESHTRTAGIGSQAYMWVYANAGTSPQVAFSGDTAP